MDSPKIDERVAPGESVDAYVVRLSEAKADAVAGRKPGVLVLAADTVIDVDGEVIGKPISRDHARAVLGRLRGRTHRVATAVTLIGDEIRQTEIAQSWVRFTSWEPRVLQFHLDAGRWKGRAGGYGLQDVDRRMLAEVSGAWSTVVGLPSAVTLGMLEAALSAEQGA